MATFGSFRLVCGGRFGSSNGRYRLACLNLIQFGYCAEKPTPIPEGSHSDFFKVEVCQIGEYVEIDVILCKAISVLYKPELFEPIRNLHRGPVPFQSA